MCCIYTPSFGVSSVVVPLPKAKQIVGKSSGQCTIYTVFSLSFSSSVRHVLKVCTRRTGGSPPQEHNTDEG